MNYEEAVQAWEADKAQLAAKGVILNDVVAYTPPEFKQNYLLAMDAQPALTTTANAGVPAFLTNLVDPAIFQILFAPTKAAQILGEVRKGTWTDQTAMFPTVEHVGEVSSYGDFAQNGNTGVNTNWPQRQSYLFQTILEYGELELERAGLARINWVSELGASAANNLNRFSNLSYFFGVQGLQNYGLLNDPNLTAAITPASKAAGGVKWILNGAINATANEVFADIQAMFIQLVNQSTGLVEAESQMTLAMSPASAVALTATNSFNVNVYDLLKKNFPNIKFETAVQYGVTSASNPQGIAAGNLVQLIVKSIEGQETGYCAFNEKMRSHRIINELSSYKQKQTGGTWGAIIRQPFGIAQMLGV